MSTQFGRYPQEWREELLRGLPPEVAGQITGLTVTDYAGDQMEWLLTDSRYEKVAVVPPSGVVLRFVPEGTIRIVLNPELPDLQLPAYYGPELDPFFWVRTSTRLAPRFRALLYPETLAATRQTTGKR